LVQEEVEKILALLRNKRENAEIFSFEAEGFLEAEFSNLLKGAGIFESKSIVVLKYPKEKKEVWDFVYQNLSALAESENAFIITENVFLAEEKKDLKKHAFAFKEFKEIKKEKDNGLFSIAGAVGRRDKKEAWLLLQSFLKKGIEAEDIFNIIFWQVKTLVLAGASGNALDAGLKEYSFRTGKEYSKNFNPVEKEKILPELLRIYHNARGFGLPLDLALEKFVLNL
jgi:DNA polymerase III delta subunit